MFDILKFKTILKKKNYAKEYDGVINVDVFNPERGIYEQRHTKVSDYQPLDLESLKKCKEIKKESLILRMFNLDALRETECIPNEVLEKINNDFEITRQAGLKLIIRFCYTEDMKEPDAAKKIVISHIQQLKPILHRNSDVIYAMQAGFIGTWGEWYYTNEDFGNSGKINDAQEANRREVVKYLLDILPKDRFLLMRTPKYKMKYLGHTRTITAMDIQARNDNYRIGFHNDAFLADDSDMGTYTSDNDKTYLAFDSRYVPVLGETCKPGPQANGQRAISQMAYYHWNALNRQYHPTVIEGWKEDGTYPEIKSRLGYRLVLMYSEIDHYATLTAPINLKLAIANDGFSSPVYPKTFFIVIENRDTKVRYTISPKNNPDVRQFYPDQTTEINLEMDLSQVNPPPGKYNVYLDISDNQFLHRPDYRIVFVNVDMEEPGTRLNNLGIYFTVKDEM